jgi:hypothetical protein
MGGALLSRALALREISSKACFWATQITVRDDVGNTLELSLLPITDFSYCFPSLLLGTGS